MLANLKRGAMALALIGLSFGQAMAEGGRGTSEPIPDAVWERMVGVSWHADLPCPGRDELRLLSVPYVDFYDAEREGQLVVAADVAEVMLDIFADIHAARFPIQNMRLVHEFAGQDGLSMSANNTSAFNCRVIAGSSRLSQHALGRAIDINPVHNPFVTRKTVSPPAGEAYDQASERGRDVPGVIVAGDAVVQAFKSRGWGWGGDWTSLKDYQHFSENGN